MKQAQRKSFDWYSMQQRYSIRKYHFGAASVLLGTALVLGTAANTQSVQAEEHNPEAINSVSVDKVNEATKQAEVSTPKKETTYAAPTVVNPVEVTPAKSDEAKAPAEKVEEAKDKKEEVTQQDAVDKSKLLTALSRAKKLEAKLYTEASAANLKASIQAGQSLLGKADATEAELSAAESSIQSAVIGLELRSNSDKGTVSETPVAKKADAAEAKEEAKPAATTTDRSILDSAVLPTSRAAIVEAFSAPKTTNEILKPGLSLSDAHQNPAIRKEDLDKGQSGFRAASNPANPIVSGSGNTVAFADISQAGRSYSFRGYGNARGGHSIHYDVTTVRQGNRLNFTIQYSGPGEFVNNNFILDKGDGFGNPSNATITTPRLREQSKPISQSANFVSHSGYTMTSATETSMQQTIRFSLPINNPNGDLSVRLKPVTFNVDQGGGGAATSNDPYSNSNYYYRANPLYLDANPNGGSSNKVVTEDIDFQTVYLPTSKLPEGQTRLVREGEKGQRQITYKVHRFGNETILGLPISNSVTKEAKPRILQIGVAKELIDTVKPRVDQNKVGDTNNLTFYLDNDGNGVYTEGVDELVQRIAIKDGAKGEKGDQGERGLTGAKGEKGDRGERGLTGAKGEKGDRGERGLTGDQGQAGRDGITPTVTVKDNKDDGTHTITINDGRGNVTSTVVRDGFDGASPLVATQRNEADKTTTVIFYYDKNGNNELDASDKKLKEVVIADGAKGERGDRGETGAAGRDGKTPKITTARGADGRSTDITFTIPGEEPVTVNVKDGKDGRTPTIDLNALAEAAVRLNNQRSGRVRRALADAPSTAPAPQPVEGTRITAYYDNNGNGKYDPGVDELIGTSDILNGTNGRNGADGASGTDGRNGAELLSGPTAPTANDGKDGDTYIDATTGDVYKKEGRNWNQIGNIRGPQGLPGPKGDKGENGKDGFTPEVTVTDNHDGSHTITVTQPEGRPTLTTIVKNGVDGQTPKVKAVRDEAKKQTTLTFYIDKDGDGNYTEGTDTLVQTSIVKDGQDGAAGQAGRDGKEVLNGKVDPTPRDGKDGDSFVNTATGDVFVKKNNTWEQAGNIKGPKGDKGENGRDGFTPEVTVTDNHDGTHTITITQPEGRPAVTTIVKNGVDGQTPKVKAVRDEAKKQTTLTFYIDKDGDGNYTEGTDTLVQTSIVKDGQDGATGQAGHDGKEVLNGKVDPTPRDGKDGDSFVNTATGDVFVKKNNTWEQAGNIKGPKGDKGENGRDGFTPEVSVTDNHDGSHTITITQPEGRPALTTIVKNGENGQTPKVKAERDEAKKQTTLTFYVDKDGDGNYTEGTDTLVQTSIVKDGQDGATGQAGRDGKEVLNGKVDPTPRDGKDGDSFVNTATGDVFVKKNNTWEQAGNIKGPKGDKGENGRDGFTPEVSVTDNHDGSHTITVTQPVGRPALTTIVKNGENGQTPKVKAERDEAKKQTTLTFYIDKDGDGNYTEGTDTLVQTSIVKDGQDGATGQAGRDGKEVLNGKVDPQPRDGKDGDSFVNTATGDVFVKKNNTWEQAGNIKGPKGDKGENGKDGFTPEVTVTDNHDGSHTITVTQPEGRPAVTTTIKNGVDGQTPKVKAERDEAKKQTTLTFYIDKDGDGNYTEGTDTLVQTSIVKDGQDGATGQAGRDGKEVLNGKVDPTPRDGKDGDSFVNTVTGDVFVKKNNAWEQAGNIKGPKGDKGENGKDGFTPEVTVTDNHDGSHTITVTQPEGHPALTTIVKNGVDGQTPKVKAVRDEAKKQTTLTFYIDKDGDGNYTEGTDTLVQTSIVKDGQDGAAGQAGRDGKEVLNGKVDPQPRDGKDGDSFVNTATGDVFVKKNNTWEQAGNIKGPKGDKGENGRDGFTPEVTVTDNHDGSHTITVTQPEGRPALTTIVKNGVDGQTPKVKAERDEAKKQTTLTFYIDKDGDGNYTEGTDTLVQTSIVKDGEKGEDGKTPEVTVTPGKDGHSSDITFTVPGKDPVTVNVKNGENGQTPKVKAERDEAKKQTTLTFYIDKDGDGNYTEGTDTLVQTSIVKDGQDGATGQAGHDGKEVLNGKVDPTPRDGKDGDSFVNTATGDVFVKKNNTWEQAGNIKGPKGDKGENGRDGFTPEVSVTDNHDGSHTITITQPEGRPALTTIVKNGENGQTPRVKAERDEAKKQTTLTFYIDKDGDGNYTEGTDTLVQTSIVKDGQDGATGQAGHDGKEVLNGKVDPTPRDGKDGDSFVNTVTGDVFVKKNNAWEQAGNIKGPKGDKGENGRDGFTPEVTVTDNHDGTHTITITQPEGRPAVTTTIKNGVDGQTPKVKAERDEAKKQTTLTFYIDKDGDGNYTEGTDTLVQTSIVKDGQDGATGQAGRDGKEVLNGKVDPTPRDGKDGDSFVNTATGDVFVKKNNTWEQAGNIKGPKGDKGENGRDGFTPEVTVTDNHDGTHTITITQPEGRPAVTTTIKNGVDGQTPKVKAERDEAKKQTTLTFYIDKDGDGNYTEGTDTLVQTSIVKDGQDGATGQAGRDGKEVLNGKVDPTPRDGKDGDSFVNTATGDVFVKKNNTWEQAGNIKGPKGDKGENGRDGFTPEVTVTDNHDGSHTITVTQPEGRPAVTTIVKNGENGQTPKVKAVRDEAKKQTTLTFYIDKDGDGNYTEGTDTLVQTSIVKDGEKGEDGKTPEVTVTPGKDGHSSDITFTVPGKDPVTVNVKNGENGLNGKTPKVDLLRVEGKNGNPSHTIVTFYTDENNDGKYTPGTDELLGSEMIKDGAKGADGRDGKSLLTVKEGKETKVYQEDPANPGQPLTPDRPLAVIRDGVDGKSPTVTAARKEEVDHKGVEITVDNHDGSQPTTVFVHDGAKGETGANGQNGQTPTVTTQRGADGHSTVVTITTPGKEPVTFTVRDGLDGHNGNNGRTPKIDLQPYINGEDSFRRARRSVGNNPDEVSGHPNSRATSSDNADGTHVTVYFDNNGNNHYDPGVDELISERDVLNGVNGENGASGRDGRNGSELLSGNIAPTPKDGKNGDTYIDSSTGDVYKKQNGAWNKTGNIRGPQGAKGDTPEVTAKPGTDGHSTDITITTPGKDPVTVNVKNGKDGKSLIAKKEGNETKIFVEDPERPGQPLDSTKPLATVLDGLKGDKGENGADGKSPVVTVTDNGDGTHSITVRNGDGSESTTKVKDGKDGKTATITTTENPDGSHTITVTNPDGTSKETVVKNGKDGKTPKVEVTDNNDGTHTVKVTDGEGNITNAIIKDGKDGKAATATTTENQDGSHTVTITNPDGTKNEFVVKNGRDGVDGRTPTASVRDNGDGSHTIVITNPEGVTTETKVRDGKSPKVTITDEQNGTHKISVLNGDGTTTETIIKDGKSPVATVTDNHNGTYTIRVENGNGTVSETTVRDGKSPTAKVVDNGDGTHTITVVNSDGTTTTTTVRDGKAPKLEVIDNNNGSHTIKVTGTDGKETTTTIFDGKSPKADIVDNGDGTHTLTIVDSDGREYKSIIKDGKDGKDGVSPTVTVKNNNDGTHIVTIINPDGSKTEMVIKDGKDGKSPKVSVEDNGDGSHTITIINSDGTVTKTVVKDGKDGRDGKDGKCGCQDKPVTPSNDKPVPPTPNVPEPPVYELPEFKGGVTPLDPPVYDRPEFNSGVPGMPEVTEVPELDIPTVPAQPTPEVPVKPVPAQPTPNVPTPEVPVQPTPVVPTPEVPVKPVPAVPEQPVVPTPAQPATPVNANPVVPITDKENHGDKLPETGSQSDYISVLLGSGILLSLYVGRRKED